jgi:hypothetical protein
MSNPARRVTVFGKEERQNGRGGALELRSGQRRIGPRLIES